MFFSCEIAFRFFLLFTSSTLIGPLSSQNGLLEKPLKLIPSPFSPNLVYLSYYRPHISPLNQKLRVASYQVKFRIPYLALKILWNLVLFFLSECICYERKSALVRPNFPVFTLNSWPLELLPLQMLVRVVLLPSICLPLEIIRGKKSFKYGIHWKVHTCSRKWKTQFTRTYWQFSLELFYTSWFQPIFIKQHYW